MTDSSWDRLCNSAHQERIDRVQLFGFSARQARFLTLVLVHSGVFLERQYRAFAGIAHGQKTHDFLHRLVARGYARAITPGAVHRGRLYHLHHKPLYEAIDDPDNRNRKLAPLGRFVERLMVLDAVLADTAYTWLGTESDKLQYFILSALQKRLPKHRYPHLTFGQGDAHTVRYFPDKLPIGVQRTGGSRHVFVYLIRRELPFDFRLFLHRHVDVLGALMPWTLRILVPRRFRKAVHLYRAALREELTMPLSSEEQAELEWFFLACRSRAPRPAPTLGLTLAAAAKKFDRPRFRAVRRTWEREGIWAILMTGSHTLKDHFEWDHGRIEFVDLPHQYLQLTSLVGGTSKPLVPEQNRDNRASDWVVPPSAALPERPTSVPTDAPLHSSP
jgi:hypothetical protein